jgi:radical SAM superfamily enzyme YgiQ (UPF0313 family)
MRLGFVALSGVRAHDLELTRLGLTLPGFVDRNRVIASLPSLGLLTLAGLTPAAFDVEYVELPGDVEKADLGAFDAVAISSFSARIKDAYRLAERYRENGVKVILGGLHVSALPAEAMGQADSVVVGEGEPVWPELLADLRAGRLRRVYDARSRSFSLEAAPMPRFELLDAGRYNRLTVQTQRGCPFRCEFCAASLLISPRYQIKPVAKVMAEIHRIKEIVPQPFIEFADDNSFVNKTHARALMRALAEEGVRWFTETDVSVAQDDTLLGLMRDSGCAQVLIGFESPARTGLEGLERHSNWKARQWDHYFDAIRRIQDHGITVNGCFILGLDGTGPESFEQVFEFVRDSGLYEVQVTIQTAFPGTPLYQRLLQKGRLLRPDAWELCTLFDVNFRPTHMTVAELEAGFRGLVTRLYDAEFTRARKRGYHRQARAALRETRRPSTEEDQP